MHQAEKYILSYLLWPHTQAGGKAGKDAKVKAKAVSRSTRAGALVPYVC